MTSSRVTIDKMRNVGPRFKHATEFKYYLYVSRSKLEMLHQQIAFSGKGRASFEWAVDAKIAKLVRKTESEDEPDDEDKLKTILRELEAANLVGSIEEPNEYFKATLPMKWGLFRDWGRPDEEPRSSISAGKRPLACSD